MALVANMLSSLIVQPIELVLPSVNYTALLGRPLRVGLSITRAYEPYIMPCARNLTHLANSVACPRPGYAVEIMHAVMTRMHMAYVVVPMVESAFGGPSANGTSWTGMLGRLHDGDVDTIVGEATPSDARMVDFAFSAPYALTSDCVAVSSMPPPLGVVNLIAQLFSMFEAALWAGVLMVGVTSTVLVVVYEHVVPGQSIAAKLVTVIGGVSAAIFMNLYVALLLSSLISTSNRAAISNLDGLIKALEAGTIRMTTEDVENALYRKLLAEPEEELAEQTRRLRSAIHASGGVRLVDGDDDKYAYAERGVGASISTSRLNIVYAANSKCDVATFSSNILGMVFETFPFRVDFNPLILSAVNAAIMESLSIFTIIVQRYQRPVVGPTCHASASAASHSNTMNMLNFVGLFIVFTVGCAAAFGALCLERRRAERLHKQAILHPCSPH